MQPIPHRLVPFFFLPGTDRKADTAMHLERRPGNESNEGRQAVPLLVAGLLVWRFARLAPHRLSHPSQFLRALLECKRSVHAPANTWSLLRTRHNLLGGTHFITAIATPFHTMHVKLLFCAGNALGLLRSSSTMARVRSHSLVHTPASGLHLKRQMMLYASNDEVGTASRNVQEIVTALQTKVSALKHEMLVVDSQLLTNKGKISTVSSKLEAANTLAFTLEDFEALLDPQLAVLDQQKALNDQFTAVLDQQKALIDQFTAVLDQQKALDDQFTAVLSQQTAAQSQIVAAECQLVGVHLPLHQLWAAHGMFSVAQGQMTAVQYQVTALQGQLSAVGRSLDGVIEQLQAYIDHHPRVFVCYQKGFSLPPSPSDT